MAGRVISEAEAALRQEMDSLLQTVGKKIASELSRLTELSDRLHAPTNYRSVDVLAEQLLQELRTAN